MKILFLTPYLPYYPPVTTNRSRPFNWLKYLSRAGHKIHLVSFIESVEERQCLSLIDKYCFKITTILRKPRSGIVSRFVNLFKGMPYFMGEQFYSQEMRQAVSLALKEESFDMLHVGTLAMAQYAGSIKGIPKILDGVDCNTRNYIQQWRHPTGLRNSILSFIDWKKMAEYEPKACSGFNRCIFVNPLDKEYLLKLNPRLNIEVLPFGVDLEYFSFRLAKEERHSLIFTGNMNYMPNLDAVQFFSCRILPIIQAKYPQIKFYVLGKAVPSSLKKKLCYNKNIIFTGHVDDIRDLMVSASVFVCPLRIGTGIKIKVLEAMAMAKPIVSTSIGAEGINVVPGKELLIADAPEDFASKVIKLLDDKSLREKLGENARVVVENDHNWELLAQKVNTIYESSLKVL